MTKKKNTRKKKKSKGIDIVQFLHDIFTGRNCKPVPCWKCKGTKWFMYDENHATKCNECCLHNDGWFKLDKHYGKDNGKMCCKTGCGFTRRPKNKKEKQEKGIWQKAQEESGYIDLSDQWD